MSIRLERLSAAELGRMVNKGEISPTEVIRYFQKRIEERNPSINAFTYTKFEEALKDANTMVGEMKGYVNRFYKAGVYDSYDNAIKKIEGGLKSPPSDKVSTPSKFKLFIQELKEAF